MTDTIDLRYQDPRTSVDGRVELLVEQLTLEEKAGLLFHAMVMPGRHGVPAPDGRLLRAGLWLAVRRPGAGLSPGHRLAGMPSIEAMIRTRSINHFNLIGPVDNATRFAVWQNKVQALARRTRLQIPVTFSSDPRNHFTDSLAASAAATMFSEWPESLGLAALRDPETVREFADIARQEYRAVGISVALHPQIDVATEPRWARTSGTFGEDVDLVSALGVAYIRGFQGEQLGPSSVATVTKHFPGGGPQKDGEDPHFPYGREQVYPGDSFELHLAPFRAAIAAGTAQIMPYYGMPVGTQYEEVGFAFNRGVITGLLREELGFEGVVCTDWGVLTDVAFLGERVSARAWGVEGLTPHERAAKALDAGVDQFGGEYCAEIVVDLVRSGTVTMERLDVSVRRILRDKFLLGLFDNPFVDVESAGRTAGRADFRERGLAAQRASVTMLKNGGAGAGGGAGGRVDAGSSDSAAADSVDAPLLPLAEGVRVYAEGIADAVLADYAVASTLEDADVAILRLRAPFEPRPGLIEAMFHAGSLEFAPEERERVLAIERAVPTVIEVYLDRPAVFPELAAASAAVVVDFGARDRAVLDVLFGRAEPKGVLPFDLPRSMDAVTASRSDVPFDTASPLYRSGDGLRYPS